MLTTVYIDFSDAQGQITPGLWWYLAKIRTHNKLARISSYPARMRMIQANMKEVEWSQHFLIVIVLGIFEVLKGS